MGSGDLPEGDTAAELINYGISLRRLNDDELAELHRNSGLAAQSEPSSASTIRLALLLGYRNSPHYDLDRAINLFNQAARTRRGEDPAFRTLAELMAALLIERRSLAVERDTLSERRVADSERIEDLQSALDEARAELDTERARSQTLQNQLNALIELEERLKLDEARERQQQDD